MTLNELYEYFIEDLAMINEDTTMDTIHYRYNSHLRAKFGNMELEDIDYTVIRTFQQELLDGTYRTKKGEKFAVSQINNLITFIKRMLEFGILMNYFQPSVEQSRGLQRIKLIIDKEKFKKQQIIWTIDDFNKFISVVDDETFRVLFYTLFFTGMRKGEILSLCWNDVNLVEQTIVVNTTACKVIGKGQVVKSPKSTCSHRIIYLNDTLNDILLDYYLHEKERYNTNIKHHYVFGNDKMISFSSLDRAFAKYKEKANVSNINMHGFRHSHATFLVELTNDIYNVSKRLGHGNIEVTDTYLHANKKIQKDIANMIELEIQKSNRKSLNSYLEELKKGIKKEMMEKTYTKEESRILKDLYDYINKI